MDFLIYLTQDSKQVLDMVRAAQFRIAENIGMCRNRNVFGFVNSGRQFVVCTSNIKGSGHNPYFYVPETVFHEAVHVAQQCKGEAFWNATANMPLQWNKMQDINKSVALSSGSLRQQEHEAFWMEDKPAEVKRVLKKFCF